jgi:hypothetical protein
VIGWNVTNKETAYDAGFCFSVVFSENRFTLFRIMLWRRLMERPRIIAYLALSCERYVSVGSFATESADIACQCPLRPR